MVENAITSGATAGLAKELGVAKLLSNGKYFEVFAETATVGVTVQLFEMSIGLRSKLDLKLIVEQAVAQVLSGKIHNELPKHTSNFIESGLDEVGNTAVNTAFGAPINLNNLAELAANYTGDTIGDPSADYLGKKETEHYDETHNITNPTNFSNQIQKVQPNLQNISPESAANDPTFNLYNAYENQLTGSVNAIAESNYAAALSSVQTDVEVHHAQRMQQRQMQKVANNSSGFFNRHVQFNEYADKAIYDNAVGFVDGGINAIENPMRTFHAALAVMEGLGDANTEINMGGLHFMQGLLNPNTRSATIAEFKETMSQVEDDIGSAADNIKNDFSQAMSSQAAAGTMFGNAVSYAAGFALGGEAIDAVRFGFAGKAVSGAGFFDGGVADGAGKYSVQYRTDRMLAKNVGYNVTPEETFQKYSHIGIDGTFITDYRAVGEILGPIRGNTKFSVGLFSSREQISYFKTLRLERALGLKTGSLIDGGFRFTRISEITELNPRCPLSGNKYFMDPGVGLPNGGPELVIDSIPTKQWPRM